MKSFIPTYTRSTIPLNTPKTIQIPSSLVDSSLVSYIVVLLILHGLKSCLFSTGWLYMTLVIIGMILHMFVSILNSYGSDLKSTHHSYFILINFPQLLNLFLIYPYILMETQNLWYFLFHMIIFMIYPSFIRLISDL